MKIGKIVILVGAIVTLVSTFLLSFSYGDPIDGRTHLSGIGFLFNLPEIWGNPGYWIATFPAYTSEDTMLIYLFSILYLSFVLSGIIQLVGLKSKYVAIIGSGLAIAFGIMMTIYVFFIDVGGLITMNRFSALFFSAPIAPGVWPLDVPLGVIGGWLNSTLSLGTITIFVGGSLGLVGGILGIKDI
ncbi:MAG: hypothetical protein ACXABG_12735 [Promethearchaeota archaeon]|jgi:hypothetical protein